MFLTETERNLIKRDFREFLDSHEPSDIIISFKTPTNPQTDTVYGNVTADSWATETITARASQKILRPYDTDILRFGILEAGDCLFFLLETIDLTDLQYDSAIVKVKDTPTEWNLVPRRYASFHDYLGFRLSNSQVSQVLPCKLKQS